MRKYSKLHLKLNIIEGISFHSKTSSETHVTSLAIMGSRPYRFGQWLPSDRKVTDEWLANLIQEVKVKSKDKLDLLMRIHPPDKTEESAMAGLRAATIAAEVKDLNLHKPVQDLSDAILSDPEINMFFHQMFWQQHPLPDTSEENKILCWQMMIFSGELRPGSKIVAIIGTIFK